MKRYQDVLLAYEWSAAVLDEGQKIRNPDANITIVCKQIPASHRIIASGTPIQNSLRYIVDLTTRSSHHMLKLCDCVSQNGSESCGACSISRTPASWAR